MLISQAKELKVGQKINIRKALEQDAKRGFGKIPDRRSNTTRRITSVGTKVFKNHKGHEYIYIGTDDGYPVAPRQTEVWPSIRL